MPLPSLILASASPRRRELLAAWGYAFQAVDPAVDEASFEAKASSPTRLVELLAEAKAQAVRKQVRAGVILAADTVVAVEDKVYGKPADRAQAANTLRALSGKAHAVLTGICVMEAKTGKARAAHAVSHLKGRDQDVLLDEAVAHLAQAIFHRKMTGRRVTNGVPGSAKDETYKAADDVAQFVLKGQKLGEDESLLIRRALTPLYWLGTYRYSAYPLR